MYKISELTKEDINELFEIEKEIFADFWSQKLLNDILISKLDKLFLLKYENKIVAYINWRVVSDECELMKIGVLSSYRQKGLAKALLDEMFLHLFKVNIKQVFLEVRSKNKSAINLYNKYGFVDIGLRKNYYINPIDDAVLMRKDIV